MHVIRAHRPVSQSGKPSSRGSISAPRAWACESASLTLPMPLELLNTRPLVKLTFETLEAGME